MVFPCFYNAPVSYYALLINSSDKVIIEQYDHYSKQTYRNRCRILGANGPIDLVVPVVKNHGKKTPMKDLRIAYDTMWQKDHWRSIVSAYASSPFFEFMEDVFSEFFHKRETFLVDLNLGLMHAALDQLQEKIRIEKSTSFSCSAPGTDTLEAIHPKRAFRLTTHNFQPAVYHQVFSEKHGFVPDLTILDLLFNEGPNANAILRESIRKK
ncbi:MAG: WbqC family protein [Bacteroidales bacterium]|nr:WbqC family protein [Bacteroidales bacterium]